MSDRLQRILGTLLQIGSYIALVLLPVVFVTDGNRWLTALAYAVIAARAFDLGNPLRLLDVDESRYLKIDTHVYSDPLLGRDSISESRIRDVGLTLESLAAQKQEGLLVIDAPATTRIGKEEKLKVTIGTLQAESAIRKLAQARNLPIETIQVYTFMTVRASSSGFAIVSPPDERDQVVDGPRPSTWTFKITATESGEQTIEVVAYARVARPDAAREENVVLEVATRTVSVSVNPVYSVSQYFLDRDKRPSWLLIVFLTGIVSAIFWYILDLPSVKQLADEAVRWLFHLPPPPKP